MTRRKKEYKAQKMLALLTQLGITMLTCIFLCVAAGKVLSERFHSDWIFPAFLILGILAGFRSCYRLIGKFLDVPVFRLFPEKDRKKRAGQEKERAWKGGTKNAEEDTDSKGKGDVT